MTQQLRTLVLAEDLGSVPNIHTDVHIYLSLQFQGIQCPLLVSVGNCTHFSVSFYVSLTHIQNISLKSWDFIITRLSKPFIILYDIISSDH